MKLFYSAACHPAGRNDAGNIIENNLMSKKIRFMKFFIEFYFESFLVIKKSISHQKRKVQRFGEMQRRRWEIKVEINMNLSFMESLMGNMISVVK